MALSFCNNAFLWEANHMHMANMAGVVMMYSDFTL